MTLRFVLVAAALTLAGPALAQDPSQIAAVRDGARACVGCNLFQADFSYREITGRDLSRSRLRQANLAVASLDRTILRDADLSLANGFAARFTGADLRRANLSGATFTGAYFGGARFEGADLRDAQFAGADLSGARGLTQAQLDAACGDAATLTPPGLTLRAC